MISNLLISFLQGLKNDVQSLFAVGISAATSHLLPIQYIYMPNYINDWQRLYMTVMPWLGWELVYFLVDSKQKQNQLRRLPFITNPQWLYYISHNIVHDIIKSGRMAWIDIKRQ
jgi:hypothetical protein